MTLPRLATERTTTTTAMGSTTKRARKRRIVECCAFASACGSGKFRAGAGLCVQPLAHFLAGLEERHVFLRHRDLGARAWISSRPRRTVLDRERTKATQLHPVAARHCLGDLLEDRVHYVLDVALVEVRILLGDPLDQFRFDHCAAPRRLLVPATRTLPNRQETVT